MAFPKGNKLGKKFSAEIQPESNGRPVGVRNRGTTTRIVFDMVGVLPEVIFKKLQEITPGIEKSMSIEQIIDTVQAFKAITDRDTQAAKYLKDNLYGAPKQDVAIDNQTSITIEIK